MSAAFEIARASRGLRMAAHAPRRVRREATDFELSEIRRLAAIPLTQIEIGERLSIPRTLLRRFMQEAAITTLSRTEGFARAIQRRREARQ